MATCLGSREEYSQQRGTVLKGGLEQGYVSREGLSSTEAWSNMEKDTVDRSRVSFSADVLGKGGG